MPIQVSSVSETWMKDVFTDKGLYCGKVEDVECDLKRFKMRSLIVKVQKGSYLSDLLGRKKGIIIPYPMVKSIGDIVLIKHFTPPAGEDGPAATDSQEE